MALDFQTKHILQERLLLILLALKMCFRSIPKLFYTSAVLLLQKHTAAYKSQTYSAAKSKPHISYLFFEDNQVLYLLDIVNENIDTQHSFTRDHLQHEGYVNKLAQFCKQNHHGEMRQQATIKVAPKSPTPACQSDVAKTLSVAAFQDRAAMKN